MNVPHGVVVAPDGSRLHIPAEGDEMVDVVDARTLRVIKRIGPLTARPNNIAMTVDGRKVYVAINSAPGGVDVIDTQSLTITKHLALNSVTIHNPCVTPDGRHLIASSGSAATPTLHVIDTRTDELLWSRDFPGTSVRPVAFHTHPDGSMKWILVNLAGLNGFAVLDFETREVIRTI
jgi:DNA-binding beta-propeller fold protein YncE